jgi:hypothetical protein
MSQRLLRGSGVCCERKQRGNLPRILNERAEYVGDRDGTVPIKASKRCGRQVALSRIANRAQHGEWNAPLACDQRDGAAFHVGGTRTGGAKERLLCRCPRHDLGDANQRAASHATKSYLQGRIRGDTLARHKHVVGRQHRAGPQRGVEPCGKAKADQSDRPVARGAFRCGKGALVRSAANYRRPTQPPGDAGLGNETDDEDWARIQIPPATNCRA